MESCGLNVHKIHTHPLPAGPSAFTKCTTLSQPSGKLPEPWHTACSCSSYQIGDPRVVKQVSKALSSGRTQCPPLTRLAKHSHYQDTSKIEHALGNIVSNMQDTSSFSMPRSHQHRGRKDLSRWFPPPRNNHRFLS